VQAILLDRCLAEKLGYLWVWLYRLTGLLIV